MRAVDRRPFDRDRLSALGRRRKRLDGARDRLIEDTRCAIVSAVGRGSVSAAEAAELTGVHRSTAHEYLKAAD